MATTVANTPAIAVPTMAQPSRFFLIPAMRSASMFDRSADLVGVCKDDRGAVTHHSGAENCRRALLRSFAARIGFEAQIPFPEFMRLTVARRHPIRVAAIGNGGNVVARVKLLQIRHGLTAAHHTARYVILRRSRGWRRMAGCCCHFQESDQIVAGAIIGNSGERHPVSGDETLRCPEP